jgi:hypothetical protein
VDHRTLMRAKLEGRLARLERSIPTLTAATALNNLSRPGNGKQRAELSPNAARPALIVHGHFAASSLGVVSRYEPLINPLALGRIVITSSGPVVPPAPTR